MSFLDPGGDLQPRSENDVTRWGQVLEPSAVTWNSCTSAMSTRWRVRGTWILVVEKVEQQKKVGVHHKNRKLHEKIYTLKMDRYILSLGDVVFRLLFF